MVIAKSKKVKPLMNNTIKNMDYNWTPGPEPPNNQDVGVPKAIFIPHSNSLPFDERRVTLEQPVKIGRNVYRATPSTTNTIFECRVLSRHHATLYYEKGHFYLVDNQSSNGTFVNNNRSTLTKEPHEVFSGDVVQFGIPVVENAGNSEKNTFPPVVALLKLYHPDGKEAKLSFNPTMTTPLHLKELYQLNNFVQEAIQREASLESRLRTLRECVERTRAEAAASWELFVGEQRLLMRVHTLEAMLAAGKHPDAHHVAQLLSDKRNYQEVAQESLRTAHEQRLALEESLERRSREAAALHHHNYALRLAATNALQELQKLAARCDRKMCAARLAIAAAEEREMTLRKHLPLAYTVQNGEAKMLIVSTDSNKLQEAKRSGSLEDAVRALPDYIKLLLPQNLLNKVGIKAISAEGKSAKEFELILMKNNVYNSEEREKQEAEDGDVGSSGEKSNEADLCTDDEKHLRLNHDNSLLTLKKDNGPNEGVIDGGHEVESLSPLDGELHPDNNANSTYSEPDIKEDSPSKANIEYANILRVMAGLNEEIRALRERVAAAAAENEQLRGVRDELLAAQEECKQQPDADDAAAYRARIADLQEQLSRSTVAEEANVAEIQRLASNAAEMQAELAFRPTRADIDDLTAVVGKLRADLIARDRLIERLQATVNTTTNTTTSTTTKIDRAIATTPSLEDLREDKIDARQISAEIDEMFQLDYDEDDETDSAVTEINKDDTQPTECSVVSEYVRLDDDERLQVTQNGTLHVLVEEEELVRAKERLVEEAIQREASLESRLRTLRECVERTRAEAAASWELFVGEQRLLMRVHTLEAMLAAGKHPDAHHVAQLLSDKRNYQEVAQESLRTAHEQRLALEESLERRSREAAALHHHNYALRLAATNALQELQKLAARCDRKMCAARLAIAAAEEREMTLRKHLPLAYTVQNGEAKMLIVSTDSNKLQEAKRSGSLEDAVRALPDYIKLLLPQNLLNKVGIKAISAEGKSAKEFELILMKNNVYNSEEREKQEAEDGDVGSSGEKSNEADLCTDDEKHLRLNHDNSLLTLKKDNGPNEGVIDGGHEVESLSPLDGELHPDNNANSTYSEPDIKEDSPSKANIEYANILRVMAGLNEEIRALRERVAAAAAENEQLRGVRDELLAAQEECKQQPDADDAAAYRARIADLQEQLSRSTVAEEANVAEIQRLASNAAEMQAELAFRPTRADIDDLTAVVGKLRADLIARDRLIERLQATVNTTTNTTTSTTTKIDRAIATTPSLEDLREDKIDARQISAEIDEMFQLDYDEDDETDSAVTEINKDDTQPTECSVVSEYVRLDDDERLQVTQNGTLHVLVEEEELVRAKERLVEVSAERDRLAAQLAATKHLPLQLSYVATLAVPFLLAWLFYLLLPYIS